MLLLIATLTCIVRRQDREERGIFILRSRPNLSLSISNMHVLSFLTLPARSHEGCVPKGHGRTQPSRGLARGHEATNRHVTRLMYRVERAHWFYKDHIQAPKP